MASSSANTTRRIQLGIAQLLGEPSARERAVGELVTIAFARLEKLARRMLRGYPVVREETGDLLAAAYQRLSRALRDECVLERLQTPHDFFNLAATQMRRELIDLSRRCARRNERAGFGSLAMDESADAPRLEPADHTFSPERLSLWTEFHEQVGRLPEAECEVFTHVWYHDLPYVEAAALLGCDERTVRRRYQSARRMLFERLGGQLPF